MSSKSLIFRAMGWLTSSLFYFYISTVSSALAIASPEIQEALQISQASFGLIVSANLITYSIMQIPVGIMLDHFSVRKLMSGAIFLFTAGCLILSISTNFYIVLISRLLMGVVASFSVLGSFKIAAEWFESKYFATLAGLTVSLGMIGATIGNHYMNLITEQHDYRLWFTFATIFGACLTLSSLIFICNKHQPSGSLKSVLHIKKDIHSVLMNTSSMILIVYAMLMYTPFLLFKESFGGVFMQTHYGLSKLVSSQMVSTMLFASLIAAPCLGVLSDRMGRRLPLLKFCTWSVFILLLLLLSKATPAGITVWLFGFFTWGFLITYTIFKETHSEHIVSTGLGVMNSINMIGGIILAPVIGILLDIIPNINDAISQTDTYFYAFLLLPLVILLAIPLLRNIPETYCQQLAR